MCRTLLAAEIETVKQFVHSEGMSREVFSGLSCFLGAFTVSFDAFCSMNNNPIFLGNKAAHRKGGSERHRLAWDPVSGAHLTAAAHWLREGRGLGTGHI